MDIVRNLFTCVTATVFRKGIRLSGSALRLDCTPRAGEYTTKFQRDTIGGFSLLNLYLALLWGEVPLRSYKVLRRPAIDGLLDAPILFPGMLFLRAAHPAIRRLPFQTQRPRWQRFAQVCSYSCK